MNGERLKSAFLPAVLLILAVFAVYYASLRFGFVYDDAEQILRNRWILSFASVPEAFTTHTWGFMEDGYQATSYRPVFFVMYSIVYAIFGFSAWGWHLVNVSMHAANAVLLFFVLRYLLEAERPGRPMAIPAFAAALVFAVHPMNAEPVSWLACMSELAFAFLCLAAFYVEARSIDGLRQPAVLRAVPALFFLAAIFLKETAVMLPVIVFVYDCTRRGARGLFSLERAARFIPYVAVAIFYAAMRTWALSGKVSPEKLHAFLTPYEFLLNAFVLMARYFKALALPFGEPPMQIMDPVFSLAEPRAAISVLFVIAAPVVLAIVLRRITRLWALMLALIILPLLPTLYSPAISRFPFADRYLYYPSVGFAMLIAVLLACPASRRRWSTLAVAAILALSIPSAVLARAKSVVWESDRTLWGAALEAQPGNYVAVHSVAAEYLKDGRAREAVELFERSLEMNLSSAHPDQSMVLLTRKVLPQASARAGLDDRAEAHLAEFLKLMPDDAPSLYNLGFLRQKRGLCNEAIELYEKAAVFSRNPNLSARAHANLGECYLALGMKDEALSSFQEALRHTPGDGAILGRMESLGVKTR